MGDLLVDQLEFERINFFILASHEHGTHSDLMEVRWRECLLGQLEISVHVLDGQKEGLVLALVAAENLDHPIDHLGSEVGGNLMTLQTVTGLERDLDWVRRVGGDLTSRSFR